MPRRLALAVLFLFAAAMASVLQQGQALWQPRPFVPDLAGARWIQCLGGSEVLYLRKEFVVAQVPERATARVSAIDEFEVFLNGIRLGSEEYIGARPVGVYDVGRVLRVGPNMLAIRARSTTSGRSASAAAVVEWTGGGGADGIASDSSWRVEDRQRWSSLGAKTWTERSFYHRDWRFAHEVPDSILDDLPLVPPRLAPGRFEGAPGQYMWTTAHELAASFERQFRLDTRTIREAFIGVATTGEFLVSVNGVVIGPGSTTAGRMPVLNIAPYLRRGDNRVLVHVTGRESPMRLAVRGEVVSTAGRLDFSSDDRWSVSPTGAPVRLLGEIREDRPTLTPESSLKVRGASARAWLRYAVYFVPTSILFLLLGAGYAWAVRAHGQSPRSGWTRYAQVLAVMALAVTLVRLADWDPRLSLAWLYPFWLPGSVLVITTAWLWGAVAERWTTAERPSTARGAME